MDQHQFERAGHDGVPRVAETIIDDVPTQTREGTSAAQQTVATFGQMIEAGIHQRPVLAVAAAATIGYVLAFLIHRK